MRFLVMLISSLSLSEPTTSRVHLSKHGSLARHARQITGRSKKLDWRQNEEEDDFHIEDDNDPCGAIMPDELYM